MGQEFVQDLAGMDYYLCSIMSEALARESKRDASHSVWLEVGVIWRLHMSGT